MKNRRWIDVFAMSAALLLLVGISSPLMSQASAQAGRQTTGGPRFKIDPFWPQPVPDRWVTGEVGGTCVDAQDDVFIVNRGNLSAKEQINATKAPPVIEFNAAGKMVNAWGDWKVFPGRPHGCFVDTQGNVWIAGNEDAIVQKYSHDGSKLLL
ncbi:MAG: hypothetical protein ACRD10_00470, partial [Terriglobia bacterium]